MTAEEVKKTLGSDAFDKFIKVSIIRNPFDYENPEHMKNLVDYLNKNHPSFFEYNNEHDMKTGHWRALEQPEIFNALKPLGHDAMYVLENYQDYDGKYHRTKNLAVLKMRNDFQIIN